MTAFSAEMHLDSLVSFLRASFQAYMAAEDALHTDGLLLGTLLEGNVVPGGMWPIPTLTPDQPAIEVAIPQQQLANFDLYGTGGDEALTVAIRAWQQEYGDVATAVERVYRKSLRMGNALVQALTPQANDAFGDHATVQSIRSAWRADPTADQRESYTSSLTMVVEVAGSGQIL